MAQVFLGVRLQCAQCHHHPFEAISQDDYFSLAAYFARVGIKINQDYGVRQFIGEVVTLPKGEVHHGRTGALMQPKPLHAEAGPLPPDRRQALADWIVRPDNPYFARNVANRCCGYLLGRGIVEPIDDLRASNPPTNPALLDALAGEFVGSGYDVKQLLRTIMNSRLYQLDSKPPRSVATDERFFTCYRVKRIAAEALVDAIDAATGVPTKFTNLPLGTRAVDLPDATYDNQMLKVFGKPKREGVCECERISEPNLAQALLTLNSAAIVGKIADPQGRLARLLAAEKTPDEIFEELYLATLSRLPGESERVACRELLAEASDAKGFYEDLFWALLNSKHFLFVH